MQFPAMADDDTDFGLGGTSRSRLSSLFHSESTSSGDVNQALTFTAPKQPKKNNDSAQETPGSLKLIHAVVVHAYKLKEGNYSSQGKLGCAILGHPETCSYKLLLYKGKQMQVTNATVTPSFIFHVQPNNYANFYDEKKENWSINFDNEVALFELAKQIALAKANCQGKSPTSLVIQDLANGEGQHLEIGDTAEVKYTGWLLSSFAFGQAFDSNMTSDSNYRVRLGKSKVIKGWHEGLLGMQKGSKRLLIIPSDLAYGSEGMGNVITPNSTLIFEIHIVKIKSARESSHSPSPIKASDSTVDKKPDVPPRQSFSQEDIIRSRGASISEQLSQSPKKDKAQLISRMAKMGTATLPFQGAIPAQVSSDSDSEVEAPQSSSPAIQNVSRTSSPKLAKKPRSRTNSGPAVSIQSVQPQPPQASIPFHVSQPSSQIPIYDQSMMPSQPPMVCAATPFPSYSPQLPGQYSLAQSPYSMPGLVQSITPSVVDSHLPILITETRNQNTEVRISLSKITDKVDTMLHKVDDLRLQGRSSNTNMPYMEGSILLQNIERIVQENSRLKEDVETKNFKIQSLNEKICDLFQRNQRFLEESSSILEQKSDSLQAASTQSQEKILNLEQEKAKLQLELSTTTIKLNTLEADLARYQKLESELSQKLLDAEKEMKRQENISNDTKERLNEDQAQLSSLQEKLKTVQYEKKELIMKMQNMEQDQSSSNGFADSVEMYKKEIQEYKEKIEQLSSAVIDSASAAKLEDEKEKIKLELVESIKLKKDLEIQVQEMQKTLNSNEELKLFYEEKIKKLETEVQNSQIVKKRFEVFQDKTRALKERYEKQILELINEIKHLQTVKSPSTGTSPEFSAEIKKVMNRLYKLLQGKFELDASYSGSKVLEMVLQTIMGLTLQVIEKQNQSSGDHSDPVESSGKGNVCIESEPSLKKSAQPEIPQQNGIDESKVEESAMPEESFSDSVLSNIEKQVEEKPEVVKQENIPTSKELDLQTNQDTSEPIVNNSVKDVTKAENVSDSHVGETIKQESPEHPILVVQMSNSVYRSLFKNTFFAILFAYVVFWIGAWAYDLEASASSTVG